MITGHRCALRYTSETHLAPILPGTSKWVKLKRFIRTLLLVSPNHPETKKYLKSFAQISNENKRQVGSYPPYIIHPFSTFRKYWHMVVFMALTLHLLTLAFDFTFLIFHDETYYSGAIRFDLFLCGILAIEIGLKFITGYVVPGTNEIVLDPRRIALNYLRYCRMVYELQRVLPYILLLDYFDRAYYQYRVESYLAFIIYLYAAHIFRFHEIYDYFKIIPRSLALGARTVLIIKLIMNTLYVLHWSACLRYILPELAFSLQRNSADVLNLVTMRFNVAHPNVNQFLTDIYWRHYRNQNNVSYPTDEPRIVIDPPVYDEYKKFYTVNRPVEQKIFDRTFMLIKLDEIRKNATIGDKYLASMMNTVKISLLAGRDNCAGIHFTNNILTTFLVLGGWIWFTYIMLIMIRSIQSSEQSQTKYEEVVNEFRAYGFNKRLSKSLKHRMLKHLECRYRKRYFNESTIMRMMSDNLRRSVRMEACYHLLRYVDMFKGFPPTLIEDIVDSFTYEIYLENDVLIEAGTRGDSMYFLASGTAAVYSSSGTELGRLIDGSHFGEVSILGKGHVRTATIIAMEDCEVYRLSAEVFQKLIEPYSHLLVEMHKLADAKIARVTKNKQKLSEEELYDNFLQ
ncbi:potassium/sodium hyperpolarization-activated cyclic nucleotide-gated channel 4 [Culex quinquefasciatus]|uniref:potassium/sodium hyperpolarization-activated cyclic nucleotide-gated channel 4 n=1 Tax=Culex quinquefasciatus TaxID=7176 RepID=UPI0018E3CF3B|nr:potassium/sodium hyperpolarization-activated cyclic nucleotide-gated channel 4 [Culex quinquefasciatus]